MPRWRICHGNASMITENLTAIRREILRIAYLSGEGHVASSFSILEILAALYDGAMLYCAAEPWWPARDRFILSKGHASLALYAVLAEKGFFARSELDTFCAPGSYFEGHPNRAIPGVEATTGSLGHGLPLAVGAAMALRLHGQSANVFCLVGDGELQEGSNWEAIAIAADRGLRNLIVIVDDNRNSVVPLSPLGKFADFGWDAVGVDGHDVAALARVLPRSPHDMPRAVIARTVKGKGCAVMEESPAIWHHRSPASEEELAALQEACQ